MFIESISSTVIQVVSCHVLSFDKEMPKHFKNKKMLDGWDS